MRSTTIKKFMAMREALVKEKAALETRLAEINEALGVASEIAEATAPAPAKKRGRPAAKKKAAGKKRGPRAKSSVSLKAAVLKVLGKKGLSRKDIVVAVQKSGYTFSTKNPLNSVSAMLYSDKKTFKNKGGKFSAV
jgi:hypothetical protein